MKTIEIILPGTGAITWLVLLFLGGFYAWWSKPGKRFQARLYDVYFLIRALADPRFPARWVMRGYKKAEDGSYYLRVTGLFIDAHLKRPWWKDPIKYLAARHLRRGWKTAKNHHDETFKTPN